MRQTALLLLTLGVWLALSGAARAAPARWTLTNPTGRTYENEVIRLKVQLPPSARQGDYIVKENGKEVPCQIEQIDGNQAIWVCASLGKGETLDYTVERSRPSQFKPRVTVSKQGTSYVIDNGLVAVRAPASADGDVPAPLEAVRLPDGKWVGEGFWKTQRRLKGFTATVIADGTVFGKVRLRYEFDGMAGLWGKTPAFAVVDVSVLPGQNHVTLEESHEMGRGDYWEFDCAKGWGAREAISKPHDNGFGRPDLGPWPPNTLKTGQTRMGDTLLNLLPRWSQAYDDGWLFIAHDGTHAVGGMVCRASKWYWPHNNMIQVKVRKGGDYAGLRCPTWKGRRRWFLLAGSLATWEGNEAKRYVTRHAFQPLDKLHHDYILDWPGLERLLAQGAKGEPRLGGFSGLDFFSGMMNPTSVWRRLARQAVSEAGKQGNLSTLTLAQVILDPDAYGSYWDFWSSENPNFFTDFVKRGIAMTSRLRGHPRFKELAKRAEMKFREDLYHSVTLPGGAGQECPGYQASAMHGWAALAPISRKYLGFDPVKWPRFKAGASFLLHLSQPLGDGKRRCHPGGDTHPLGPDVLKVAGDLGVLEDVKRFKTEELPGFGVVFRNRPGTGKETYLAFKSGPNRGHYHGDPLSFHYCALARPVAIDHMCSYSPRAGQEHMHNRVAFHTDRLPYANMDGYERVIAFKTSGDVDVAMGQVESERLRVTEKHPPEKWDWYLPQQKFDTPLKYRRTIVLLKNKGRDYFVIRDQHAGPNVKATYCLHVLSGKCNRSGNTFDFGNLTVFCAKPRTFAFAPFDWSHERRNIKESTKGIRLTVEGERSEFITVLYPGKGPKMTPVPGGVKVGDDEIVFGGDRIDDDNAATYVTVRRAGRQVLTLGGTDIDMDRFQGEIGLFVPDAGYPFGEIPDWLIKQRIKKPAWLKRE